MFGRLVTKRDRQAPWSPAVHTSLVTGMRRFVDVTRHRSVSVSDKNRTSGLGTRTAQ